MLYAILSKLPKPLDLEGLISRTEELYRTHPPESLPWRVWSRVSSSSVLKTTRIHDSPSKQTLQDGERFFRKEEAEIRRRELFRARQRQLHVFAQRYRRPLLLTSTAIFVAVISLLIRRSDASSLSQG